MKRRHHVMVRLSDQEAARLDELRGAQSRAVYMRTLLQKPPREDEIATRGEALALLTGLARGGSVGASVARRRRHGDPDQWRTRTGTRGTRA